MIMNTGPAAIWRAAAIMSSMAGPTSAARPPATAALIKVVAAYRLPVVPTTRPRWLAGDRSSRSVPAATQETVNGKPESKNVTSVVPRWGARPSTISRTPDADAPTAIGPR